MTRFAFFVVALGLTGCATGDSRTNTILGLSGDAANGGTVFAANCASCHGAAGDGGSGPAIAGDTEVDEIASIVLNGEEEMPAFADTLSDQEIADVIAWVGEQG